MSTIPQPLSVQSQANVSGVNPEKIGRVIAASHLFGIAGQPKNKVEMLTKAKNTPETKLNLSLIGVFAFDPQEQAMAVISSGARNEKVYGIGEKIVGQATLKAVYSDKVIIANNGREETLTLPKNVAPIDLGRSERTNASSNRSNMNTASIDLPTSPRELRDKLVKNPSMLGKIISASPYQEGGKLIGYRLTPKQNPEILAAQGIMPNDVITQVNGISLNSQKKGIRALRKLVKADSIELTILRDGMEIPVVISMQ